MKLKTLWEVQVASCLPSCGVGGKKNSCGRILIFLSKSEQKWHSLEHQMHMGTEVLYKAEIYGVGLYYPFEL